MFLENLKKIFVSLKSKNFTQLEKYNNELQSMLYISQVGGDVHERLKGDIDPIIDKLKLNTTYIKLSLKLFDSIEKMLSKLDTEKIEELNRLNVLISEMKQILTKRLESN